MDDSWGLDSQTKVQENQIAVKEQPVTISRNRRGERGEDRETEETKPLLESQNDDKASQNQEEGWIVDENKESEAVEKRQFTRQNVRNKRGQSFQNSKVQDEISCIVHPEATELTPQQVPKEIEDSWCDAQPKQKKEEQLKKDEQVEENQNRVRGNRGNRGNRGKNQEENQFLNNNQNNQENQETTRRGNRGNRDYNRDQNTEGGYRNYGRNNQDRQDRGNRGNRGSWGDRGNWADRGERGDRGGRGDFRGRGNYRGGFNGNRDRNDREQRGPRNDQEDRNNRGNRSYNFDRNYNNQSQADQKPVKEQKIQSISSANFRRAWPSCQIFIYGKKLAITLRRVQQFNSKILVVPYRNLKFDYYPGNFVLSSSASYREKIIKKGEQCQKGGAVYFQKAVGLGQYQALVFLKIDQSNKQQNLQNGIDYIMKNASWVRSQITLDSLVFPLSKDLSQSLKILQIFSKSLQTYNTIKQVYITTNEPQIYQKCMKDFSQYIVNSIDNNDLSLD